MKDHFHKFQLKQRWMVIMKLNKEADILQISPTCWSVLAFCFGTCDCSVWCNRQLLPWNPFTGKRHSGRKWARGNKEMKNWAIHIIRLFLTSENGHILGGGVAKEMHKMHAYIHYWSHDNPKTDMPKVFWESLFFFFFCGIFSPSTLSWHLSVLHSISTSLPVFLGLKE